MTKIKAINISNLDGENTFYINQAILNKNKGIVNDRYYETSGINLNNTLTKKIQINNVILKVHQLCQPCKYLQNKLGVENLVKLLVHKSGVRAEILRSGEISTYSHIKILK